ncbi:SIMPL domain-containing protein [Maritalea sp.]|uniref:SIMPL domain-containing protein n=1 Tax=Maritalea sp. TaxID=2003361 RepID=UPI003EFAFB2F
MLKKLLPLSAIIILGFSVQQAAAEDQIATINISATGNVTAAPDMAIVTSGVVTEGETARDALSANNEAMSALIEVLKGAGIEAKHIQTSNFSVQPNYVHSDKRDQNGYTLAPKINGYRVSNMVTVGVLELDNLGDVLDKAVTVGANSVNGVSFAVAEPAKLLDEARKNAIMEALKNAKIYADAADLNLDRILSISENSGHTPQPYANMARMEMAMSDSVPVQAGELDYSITVNVTWQISE